MRVRTLDANLDMTFGNGKANFLVNSRACVGQCVLTALKLLQGEWFLNTNDGVPYQTKILGTNTSGSRDQAVRAVILGVENVTAIAEYQSRVVNRQFIVGPCTIDTAFGETLIPPVTL